MLAIPGPGSVHVVQHPAERCKETTVLSTVSDGGIGRVFDQGHGHWSGLDGQNRPPVVGLGGSRIVVRSPSNPTLVWKISKEEQETERKLFRLMGRWTPGRVRALGAHRVQEVGPQGSVFYASVLEMEMCSECPRFCTQTAFEALLTIVHTAKFRPSKGRGEEKPREHSIRR